MFGFFEGFRVQNEFFLQLTLGYHPLIPPVEIMVSFDFLGSCGNDGDAVVEPNVGSVESQVEDVLVFRWIVPHSNCGGEITDTTLYLIDLGIGVSVDQ